MLYNLHVNIVANVTKMYYHIMQGNKYVFISGDGNMPNIKPISELRNYTKVINEVRYGNRVYLTKNGHGQIALINMQELDDMEKELALYRFKLEMEKGERSIIEEGTVSSEDAKKELGLI